MAVRDGVSVGRFRDARNRARRNLITRTARVWTRLYKTAVSDLKAVSNQWLTKVMRQAEREAATGMLDNPLQIPEQFTKKLSRTLREAYAYGYWLNHLYVEELKAAKSGYRYRGKVSLSDMPGEDELREILQNFMDNGVSDEWDAVIPQEAIDWLKDYVPKLSGNLGEVVSQKVNEVIRSSMQSGSTLKERMKALRESAPELSRMSNARIEAIARTEVTRASTLGSLVSMKRNDDVIGVEFSAVMDDRTTEICSDRHGLVMRLDDPRLAENTPPLHINCRSMLLSLTVYDYPDGVLTSHEFDNVPAGGQRTEDVEEVRKILSAGSRESIAVQQSNNEILLSGALNDRNDPDGKMRERHAKLYYEELRNSKSEPIVERLSQNSGVSLKSAQKVYEHVFLNEYELYDGELRRFDPSYDMAESFRRLLADDDIQEHDIILLHHERLEYELMKRYGKKYRAAHAKTCEKYDYDAALKKWKKERGD